MAKEKNSAASPGRVTLQAGAVGAERAVLARLADPDEPVVGGLQVAVAAGGDREGHEPLLEPVHVDLHRGRRGGGRSGRGRAAC